MCRAHAVESTPPGKIDICSSALGEGFRLHGKDRFCHAGIEPILLTTAAPFAQMG
jgi:hypothetical protein